MLSFPCKNRKYFKDSLIKWSLSDWFRFFPSERSVEHIAKAKAMRRIESAVRVKICTKMMETACIRASYAPIQKEEMI